MKIIRESSEDEVLLEFLKGEIKSHRFREDIENALEKLNYDALVITEGNTENEDENEKRRRIMSLFRGYPDREIYENYPKDIKWTLEETQAEDLEKIFYIQYSYWDEISSGTSRPSEAAVTIRAGKEIFGVSNQNFWRGFEHLKENTFPPVTLLTCNNQKYVILEGHCRMTAYALAPDKFPHSLAYVGHMSEEDMKKYDPRMV